MACASDRGGCVHEHDGHQHGGHDDDSQQDTSHGAGCCGGPAVNAENPKPTDIA